MGEEMLKFIASIRFMASSLSNHVNNSSEDLPRIKCKLGHGYKNVKHVELILGITTVFSNIQTLKMI